MTTDTNRAEPIKLCPFCRSSEIAYTTYNMACRSCGAGGPSDADVPEAEAIAAWNRRAEVEASRLPQADNFDAAVEMVRNETLANGHCTACGALWPQHHVGCASRLPLAGADIEIELRKLPELSEADIQALLEMVRVAPGTANELRRKKGLVPVCHYTGKPCQYDAAGCTCCLPGFVGTPPIWAPLAGAATSDGDTLQSLIEQSDGVWKEDVFCIGSYELMALLRAVASASPAPSDAAVPQNIRERWNIEMDGNDLLVCFNAHEKGVGGRYERYVPAGLPTAPAGAREAPNGDWLWIKLMDWCAKRKVHPGDYNDLFSIVGEARAALAAAPLERIAPDTARLDWLFANCRIVYFPPANGGPTPYPIEHNPRALGYGNKRDSTPILQFADAAIKAEHGITLAPIAGKGDGNG